MNALTIQHVDILTAIGRQPLADSTKKQYRKAIKNALAAGVNLTDAGQLGDYATTLKKSPRAFLKASLRLWADNLALRAKAANAGTVEVNARVRATIDQLDVLKEVIRVEPSKGQKAHTWLSQSEVKRLLENCDSRTTQGKRDKVVLGLLVGAGLRREELAGLTFDDIALLPVGGNFAPR